MNRPPESLDPHSISLGLMAGLAVVLGVLVLIKLAMEAGQ